MNEYIHITKIFCIINIPLPDDIAALQQEAEKMIDRELEQNYGREEGEINDSEVDELMQPLYDEHDGK